MLCLWLRFGEIHKLQGTQAEHRRFAWKSISTVIHGVIHHVPNDMLPQQIFAKSVKPFPSLFVFTYLLSSSVLHFDRLYWFDLYKKKMECPKVSISMCFHFCHLFKHLTCSTLRLDNDITTLQNGSNSSLLYC